MRKKIMMKKIAILLAAASALSASATIYAQESPWLLRARVVNIDPTNQSSPVGGVGASDTISISSKSIPEFDISYFVTPNWAAELILTYPQSHDVYLSGSNIGSFKELPPTLLAQYHFMPTATVSPYIGAGLNYTRISNVSLLNGAGTLDAHSFGPALQVGLDYKINNHWLVNFDLKKVQMRSNVYVSGAQVSTLHIDPLLFGLGVGYRF